MSESARDPLLTGLVLVRTLMSQAPPGVDQFVTVVNYARRLRASGTVALPVTDERLLFLGMLSDRDVIEQCVADGQDPNAVTVGSLVRPGQATIDPDRVADAAVLAMIIAQPQAELPVVQDGRLVGLLSIADLAVPMIDQFEDHPLDLDQLWTDDSRY